MDELCKYANRPFAFIGRYLRGRYVAHLAILVAVVGAVSCSVATQYGVKFLIDTLAQGPEVANIVAPFAVLAILISADNLLWRLACWIGSFTFVRVSGDLRRELFRHLTGHAPNYFLSRLPGTLTSRITATSNAVFTIENMFVCNVLPPCIATVGAIIVVLTVSPAMAGVLVLIAAFLIVALFRLADAGKPLADRDVRWLRAVGRRHGYPAELTAHLRSATISASDRSPCRRTASTCPWQSDGKGRTLAQRESMISRAGWR